MLNINEEILRDLHTAVDANAVSGEEVGAGASFGVVANPDGTPAVITVIVLRISSLVLGEYLTASFYLSTPAPTSQQISESVADALNGLRQARDEQADQIVAQSQDSDHGHGHGHLGLPGH